MEPKKRIHHHTTPMEGDDNITNKKGSEILEETVKGS